jgi:LemA protein
MGLLSYNLIAYREALCAMHIIMTIGTIILIIIAVVILWAIFSYNGFVRLRIRLEEAWADIDVQLKRRFDLIPNLVETVKGYAGHEKEVFIKVTEARTAAMTAEASGNVAGTAQAENMLSGALKSLFAVAEAYPQLQSSENFQELQRELSDTENKIQAARRFYNSTVRDYNTKRETVPSSIIASLFKFEAREFFDLEGAPEERENIAVKF